MKGTALLYRPGSAGPEITEFTASPGLEFLQSCVSGYVEAVPSFASIEYDGKIRPCVTFCNEEGKLDGLPLNQEATLLWDRALRRTRHSGLSCPDGTLADVLVGPIVVLIGDEEFIDSL
jgi:hypothetical protein